MVIAAVCVLAAIATTTMSQVSSTPLQQGQTNNIVTGPAPEQVSNAPLPAGQDSRSVSGQVIDGRGRGLAGRPVTLHLVGFNYTGDEVTGTWEVYTLETTTNDGADAGRYAFDNVVVTPDIKYCYVSSHTSFPDGLNINGITRNFTLESDISTGFLVLPDPRDVDPGLI